MKGARNNYPTYDSFSHVHDHEPFCMSSLKTPICQMPGTYSVSLYMPGLPLRPLRGHSLGTQMTAQQPPVPERPRGLAYGIHSPRPPAEVNRTRPPADRLKSSIRRWPRRPPRRPARGPGPHHRPHHGLSPRLRPPQLRSVHFSPDTPTSGAKRAHARNRQRF